MNFFKLRAKDFIKIAFATLMVFVFSFGLESCSKKDDSDPTPAESKPIYSGEDLYRGLFFSEGDVSKKLANVNPNYIDLSEFYKNESERKASDDFKNKLVASINTKFPDFFAEFKTKIESGNPLHIQQALNYASGVNQEVLASLPEYQIAVQNLEQAKSILGDVDFNQFIDENNKIDREGLEQFIKEKIGATDPKDRPACLSAVFAIGANAVIVWNAAVLINAAAGVNVAFAVNVTFGINVAAGVNVAYAQNYAVTYGDRGNYNYSRGGCGGGENRLSNSGNLQQEMFISGIANTL